jgi:TRAP-type uncharacterized transport system substrate-binding protein
VEGHPKNASATRADALYEIALDMWNDRSDPGRAFADVRLALDAREPKAGQRTLTFAVDTDRSADAVVSGAADVSIFNPSAFLTMAVRGTGPFPKPLPLRTVAVMPSWDRMGFAIAERAGVGSLAEIRERRLPLRISVRGADTDTTRFVVDQVLAVHGFSLQDVEAWGGSLQRSGNPLDAGRLQGIADGSIDAVFDEGIGAWAHLAFEHGMRLLPIGQDAEQRMVELGWEIKPIPRGWDARLAEDIPAIDFSGWPMFARADLPDEIVYRICQAIDSAKARIPWDTEEPVTLADICNGNDAAPLGAALHPGAERYYREHGALS